jgi:hypothetical protein
MSRDLPSRPHLDHLRKQAKELLRTLQQQDPGARRADAQHALAQEYGFSSWPRLKAHVEQETTVVASPFVGRWTADLTRSTMHPDNPLRRASIGFDVAGNTVKIDYVMDDGSGRTDRGLTMLVADGREHPSTAPDGFMMRVRWRGSHGLEAVVFRHGEVEGRVEYSVSSDGRTLTLASCGPDGVERVSVFVRGDKSSTHFRASCGIIPTAELCREA